MIYMLNFSFLKIQPIKAMGNISTMGVKSATKINISG